MNRQELLLKSVRKKLLPNESLNDKIAEILDISYDAAHRRTSLKSKFSIEEIVKVCQFFNFSMDQLFFEREQYFFEKTTHIKSKTDFIEYFNQSIYWLSNYKDFDSTLYYFCKDIPLFYSLGGTLLSKFKLYVWMNLLEHSVTLPFEKFQLEQDMLLPSLELKKVYDRVKVVEIWNDTSINSNLQQVYYFFEAGLLNYENALLLIEDIEQIIHEVENKTNTIKDNYKLYFNELLILNNNVLLVHEKQMSFFNPYNIIGYLHSHDAKLCKEVYEFTLNQISNSLSISDAGKKEKSLFFGKIYQKIDFFRNRIKSFID